MASVLISDGFDGFGRTGIVEGMNVADFETREFCVWTNKSRGWGRAQHLPVILAFSRSLWVAAKVQEIFLLNSLGNIWISILSLRCCITLEILLEFVLWF
jgi:hypothetical protein